MRKLFGAAAVLAIALPAFAQTTPPGPPTATVPGPIGQTQTGTAPPAPGVVPSAPAATAPGSVLKPGTPDSTATAPIVPKAVPGAPVAGANSFTESQAKARIEANGYTNVTALKKDDQSIWRGTATKGGKQVSVALDYQGNVVGE